MRKIIRTGAGSPRLRVAVTLAVAMLGFCLAISGQVETDELAAERTRVLTSIGETRDKDLDLFPIFQGVGLVFQQPIVELAVVNNLRVHFVIQRSGEAWGIQIKDEAGAVAWSTWDDVVSGIEFWSDEIAGNKVTVEVYSSRPSNLLQLVIDKIAIRTPKVTPVSITGVNQLTSINGQDDWIVQLGRSVARVRFVGDGGKVFVCTAFLVAPDIMLTNQHCIATQSEMESALVDFDFDNPGQPGRTLRLRQLLWTNFALDYSVVRLERPVGRVPLKLNATGPSDDEKLLIIQHPGGEPKQISLADCEVDGALVTGRVGTPTDFGHQCDTKGGSSGSPVIHLSKRQVVGLHHLGISPWDSNLFNRASHIGQVLADMDPLVLAEIEAGQ